MGQWAELSQWKPRFLCPVRMSQMMIACGSSCVSMRGLKVTRYLEQRCPVWGCGYHSPRLHPSVSTGTPWNSYTLQVSSQTSVHERDTRAPLTSPTIHHNEFQVGQVGGESLLRNVQELCSCRGVKLGSVSYETRALPTVLWQLLFFISFL